MDVKAFTLRRDGRFLSLPVGIAQAVCCFVFSISDSVLLLSTSRYQL